MDPNHSRHDRLSSGPTLRIGTRGSDLALWQARRVAELVTQRCGLGCEIEIIKTRGDRIRDVALHKMDGKGFFTKELQQALQEGRVDLVVHSLKDLPTDQPEGLELVAILERADATDSLLAEAGLLKPQPSDPLGLPVGAVVGTSSLRRAAQTLALSPHVKIKALRGNVPTRISKLCEGQYDAILLATAGIRRLDPGLDGLECCELRPEVLLPAPGQGALAVEVRKGDQLTATLTALNQQEQARCTAAERTLLALLEGGCHLPLGCLATAEPDGAIRLQAVLGEIDEEVTTARVARVAAVAPTPGAAARACFEALGLAECKPSGGAP